MDGWLTGTPKHETLTVYSSSCNWDKLEFGTNGGLVQVDKFKDMPEVEGFISQQVNWTCGNGGYSHKKCPGLRHDVGVAQARHAVRAVLPRARRSASTANSTKKK